jgi:hypothetical protein
MVLQAATKINKATGSRHTIYLRTELLNDSKFPFKIGQQLIIRIDGDRLIVEASKPKERDRENE